MSGIEVRALVLALLTLAMASAAIRAVLPYWQAAWILTAAAGADLASPPGAVAARTDDIELAGRSARVYRPDAPGRYPSLVVAHSFNEAGERDARLAASLGSLARAGVVLVVPRLDAMTASRVELADVDALVDTFRAAADLPYVRADRRGLGGYSWSAGYALIAAADPRVRDDVRLVLSVGGYASAASMFASLVSGEVGSPGGGSRRWEPHAWAVETARHELARRADGAAWGEGALGSRSYAAAIAALERAPAPIAAELDALSPLAAVRGVRAPVVLLHGLGDPVVPEEETRRLERALRDHTEVRALETALLHHVNLADVRGALASEGTAAVWRMVEVIAWALRVLT